MSMVHNSWPRIQPALPIMDLLTNHAIKHIKYIKHITNRFSNVAILPDKCSMQNTYADVGCLAFSIDSLTDFEHGQIRIISRIDDFKLEKIPAC